jgi:ubiquinone/menaquinone biosynthesis C-methylase UbiE
VIIIPLDKKKEIIKKYNSTSHFYDKRYTQIQYEKFEIILNSFKFSEKILLDAGCGTGLLLQYIIQFLKTDDFSYVATDISLKMLKIFSSKVKEISKKKFQRRLNLILSDLENLPFRNNVFHSVFAPTSLQNLPSIQNGIEEIIRTAKNNADLKLTILKKKLDIEKLKPFLKPKVVKLEILNLNNVEDVIIQGIVNKI